MKNKNTTIIIVGVVVLTVALIFFGRSIGGTSSSQISVGGNGAAPSSIPALDSGGENDKKLAPDFTLTKLSGEKLSLSDYRGEKPVILDFFATWCPNCQRDMPKLSIWYEKYQDNVEVIGVNLREREKTVRDFISSRDIAFPIVLDPFSQVSQNYGVQYTNYHVLINTDGTFSGIVPGDISEAQIVALIESNSE